MENLDEAARSDKGAEGRARLEDEVEVEKKVVEVQLRRALQLASGEQLVQAH